MALEHESVHADHITVFSYPPPAGPPFSWRKEKGGKEIRPSNAGGLTPAKDLVVDAGRSGALPVSGCWRDDGACARRGRYFTSLSVTRRETPASCAMALPRKTVWWIHGGSVPYGSRRLSRTAVLAPDAGAGFFALDSGLSSLDCLCLTRELPSLPRPARAL